MRRFLIIGMAALLALPVAAARAAVGQSRESGRHEVFLSHDLNICGDLGTFAFDVTWHAHSVDNGTSFAFDYTEAAKWTLVFDDPALGTWTAHSAESIQYVANPGGEVFHQNFNGREGDVQIVEHRQFRADADGNVTVDRSFEIHAGCPES